MDEAARIAIGVASGSAAWAGLQLALSGWRDLGPMTVGTAAIAVGIAAAEPSCRPTVAALVSVAAVGAMIAWGRGAGHGVGRPGLSGLVLGVAVVASLAPWSFGIPTDADYAVRVAIPVGVTAALAALIALERKGVRRVRPAWYRTVPIER